MRALVTDFDRTQKIQAIKGIRAVAQNADLKGARDFIEGPLPAIWECGSAFTWQGVQETLEAHGVQARCADENAGLLDFLAALPADMTVAQVRATLIALGEFRLPAWSRA